MVEKDDKFDLILTILEQIQEKLHKIVDSYKFEDSEEPEEGFDPFDDRPVRKDLEGEKEVRTRPPKFDGRNVSGDDLPIHSKLSKTQRKYKISGKPCMYCDGLISWDDFDTKTKTGRPVHVDGDGYKIGNGSCPNWRD